MINLYNYTEFLSEKIQLKRKYTEKYPAVIHNKTELRKSIFDEINEDDELEYNDFYNKLSKHTTRPKEWVRNNSYYFDDVKGKVRLSKRGKEYKRNLQTSSPECCVDEPVITED